ncbi:hypothetical protein BsWGS_00539 [Bradybaena similaris]
MAASREVRVLRSCLCYFLTYIIVTDAINLDAKFSVIKRGKANSYFGFSVAQHQVLTEPVGPSSTVVQYGNVLLVGAPKEVRRLGDKDSGGALYRCDARDAAESCLLMEDGTSTPPTSSELIDDQWLGVTVASQGSGKKAVACAHRYVKNNAALGVCYTFIQTLDYENIFIPCNRLPHRHYLQDFGLCQAGMSAAIGQDDAFVMGAPGSVLWQGVIFATNVTDQLGVSQIEIVSPYADPKLPAGNAQPSPTNAYSYNGYAVTVGKYDGTRALYYVSGAPKSNNKGEIVFFKQAPGGVLRYEKPQIIQGSMDFSGFGSSLETVDLNNDGYDDLIVGAPYYYKRNRGGAIYVFLGGEKMITSDTVPIEILSRSMGDEECEALKCEHARFGLSISKLGDVNKDSYQDFAVGAPYEGNGTVYIYHGSKTGFNKEFAQRIAAEDLPVPGLVSFGYSLSGGIDLDENEYPDLLVGAYESDAVALIRSRPIIKLIPELSVFPKAVNLESAPLCDHSEVKPEFKNRHCIAITMCLSFTTKPANSIKVIPQVIYRLEVEPNRRVARVELQDVSAAENKTLTLNSAAPVCVTELALLKSQFDDKLNLMEFRYSFGLSSDFDKPDDYPKSAVQDLYHFPVLDTEGAEDGKSNAVSVNAGFVMECGDDNKCFSNLQFTAELKNLTKNASGIYEMSISQQNHLHIVMRVHNIGEPAYLTRIYINKPQVFTYLGTEQQDTVACQWLKEEPTLIVCDQIGNPLRSDKVVYFTLKLNVPQSLVEANEIYNITAWVNTSSIEDTPLNDYHTMLLHVINKAEISLTTTVVPDSTILCKGEPRDVSAITNEIDIGTSVQHNFIVRNSGPGVVSESYINISWPYEVGGDKETGKYLLYLMRKPKIVGPVIKCNDADIEQFINPHRIRELTNDQLAADASRDAVSADASSLPADAPSSRRKREADTKTKRATTTLVFSCHDRSARCFEYRCRIGKLQPNADFVKITMEARLWESTLLSDYRKVADVQIQSWGEITVPSKLMITQDKSDDKRRAITRAVPDFKETAGQVVQWWIILVAVLIGLIVLLLVIFVLYKLGFFRRKRMEDMQMYKAEKKQQPMLQDEYEDDAGYLQ